MQDMGSSALVLWFSIKFFFLAADRLITALKVLLDGPCLLFRLLVSSANLIRCGFPGRWACPDTSDLEMPPTREGGEERGF